MYRHLMSDPVPTLKNKLSKDPGKLLREVIKIRAYQPVCPQYKHSVDTMLVEFLPRKAFVRRTRHAGDVVILQGNLVMDGEAVRARYEYFPEYTTGTGSKKGVAVVVPL
jgi:hypothetical protein